MSVLNYEELTMDSETFQTVRDNFDLLLQKLLKKMLDNESEEGSITLKVDVTLKREWIPVSGEHDTDERMVHKPTIKHKISTAVPVKDSIGGKKIQNMELVFDPNLKRYVLKHITGTPQMSIFDEEFQNGAEGSGAEQVDDSEEEGEDYEYEPPEEEYEDE